MLRLVLVIGMGSELLLTGCTLAQMNRDSDARESRIPMKQMELSGQREQNTTLMNQRSQLESQRAAIEARESELNETLESSSQRVSQMTAETQQQKKKQRELQARLGKIKSENAKLQAQPDTDAKRQRLEDLQREADQLFALPLGKDSVK